VSDRCERCGAEILIGMFPFCRGNASDHGKWYGAEEPLSPYWDEHISPEGAEIRTRGERRRLMDRNGLDYHDVSKKKRGRVYVFTR
jgi:hypothetical protein